MNRNLVLCADGTGNKGGSTPDSNVFKMFNAIDIHTECLAKQQLTFYDNGVGTSKIDLLKALSGGFGFGFGRNVCDLYKFLAYNYQPGDRVFVFGFSRGAATIRALTGFIGCCGLIDGRNIERDILECKTLKLFEEYKKAKDGSRLTNGWAERFHGNFEIEFVGVWDTVSALGFPQGTDVIGPASLVMSKLFNITDWVSNFIWPHRFYQYQLFPYIKHGYHAVAIDDERTAFQPIIWDETGRPEGSVEQVWFAGMHSNVGGGYERNGLANIPLYWMMAKANKHGLIFKEGYLQEAYENSNANGHLYNSRSGLAVYYRYHPREIEKLCAGKIKDIKIHQSVIDRMSRQTADYAPGNLPAEFSVSALSAPPGKTETNKKIQPGSDNNWSSVRNKIQSAVYWLKQSYMVFLLATLFIVGSAIIMWNNSVQCDFQIQSASNAEDQQKKMVAFIDALAEKKELIAAMDNMSWDARIAHGFKTFFDPEISGCSVLMVNLANQPTQWVIDGSQDAQLFGNLLIKHSGNALSIEAKIDSAFNNNFADWTQKHLAEILTFILPRAFDNLIQEAVVRKPFYFIGAVVFFIFLWWFASTQRSRKHKASVQLRKIVMDGSQSQQRC